MYVREPDGSLAGRAYPDEWIKDVMLSSTQHPFRPAGLDPQERGAVAVRARNGYKNLFAETIMKRECPCWA